MIDDVTSRNIGYLVFAIANGIICMLLSIVVSLCIHCLCWTIIPLIYLYGTTTTICHSLRSATKKMLSNETLMKAWFHYTTTTLGTS